MSFDHIFRPFFSFKKRLKAVLIHGLQICRIFLLVVNTYLYLYQYLWIYYKIWVRGHLRGKPCVIWDYDFAYFSLLPMLFRKQAIASRFNCFYIYHLPQIIWVRPSFEDAVSSPPSVRQYSQYFPFTPSMFVIIVPCI